MPTITISAADSATAMDQIIAQLGDDAMIIDTRARDGKVEIRATNDLDLLPKKPRQISDVFAKVLRTELDAGKQPDDVNKAKDEIAREPTMSDFERLKPQQVSKTQDGVAEQDQQREINIQVRRLKWENERLEKEAASVRQMSHDAVETARKSQEQVAAECDSMRTRLDALIGEVDTLRTELSRVNHANERQKQSQKGRRTLLMMAMIMGLAAGGYTMRDKASLLMPWVGDLMQSVGASVKVGVEYFQISHIEAKRMGDTVRVKVRVTNSYPLPAKAPIIRFLVKDSGGVILAERNVAMDYASLSPTTPTLLGTQIVLPAHLGEDVLTDIVAVPMAAPTTSL
ncbi:MAG: hypothetical protein VW665_06035 [Candidatus Puniceispirillum sp.]